MENLSVLWYCHKYLFDVQFNIHMPVKNTTQLKEYMCHQCEIDDRNL